MQLFASLADNDAHTRLQQECCLRKSTINEEERNTNYALGLGDILASPEKAIESDYSAKLARGFVFDT
jgi:hypothetical protein